MAGLVGPRPSDDEYARSRPRRAAGKQTACKSSVPREKEGNEKANLTTIWSSPIPRLDYGKIQLWRLERLRAERAPSHLFRTFNRINPTPWPMGIMFLIPVELHGRIDSRRIVFQTSLQGTRAFFSSPSMTTHSVCRTYNRRRSFIRTGTQDLARFPSEWRKDGDLSAERVNYQTTFVCSRRSVKTSVSPRQRRNYARQFSPGEPKASGSCLSSTRESHYKGCQIINRVNLNNSYCLHGDASLRVLRALESIVNGRAEKARDNYCTASD